MRVDEINGAVALSFEPGDLAAFWQRVARFLTRSQPLQKKPVQPVRGLERNPMADAL